MRLFHRVPIIKVVGDACNLRCDYCFYHGREQQPCRFLSHALLESFLQQYFTLFQGEMSFVWHGGEPLLAGIDFYEDVLALQKRFAKAGDVVENKIQTNGTLVTDDWALFFKKNDFRIGVSLDGNKTLHDRHRKNAGHSGSFGEVLRGISILRRHGISPGVIQTITRGSLPELDENFRFFVEELGLNGWATNLFHEDSSASHLLIGEGLRDEDVSRLFEFMLSFWLAQNDSALSFREIENAIAGVSGHRAKSCSYNGTCASYFCLDADGRVWPCDRLSTDSRYLLGDLTTQTLEEILTGGAAIKHEERSRQLAEDCVSCRWRNACNNGCTAMRDPDTDIYVYCGARKSLFGALSKLTNAYISNQAGNKGDVSVAGNNEE